jgi:hypothetical protein
MSSDTEHQDRICEASWHCGEDTERALCKFQSPTQFSHFECVYETRDSRTICRGAVAARASGDDEVLSQVAPGSDARASAAASMICTMRL